MEIDAIVEHWQLPSDTQVISEVTKGVLSTNFIIGTSKQRWFLKRYRFDDGAKIKEIHGVKRHFSSHGIPVIMPLEGRDESTAFHADDGWYSLFPFIDGRQPERELLTPTALTSAAQLLAKIHLLSKTSPFVVQDIAKDWDGPATLEKAEEILAIINAKPKKDDFDLKSEAILKVKMELVRKNTVSFAELGLSKDTLCHGDYQEANMFFDEDDRVSWLFDWEKADMEPRTYEVLRAMELMCMNGNFTQRHIDNAKHFVRSYHEAYPLNHEELAAGLTGRRIRGIHSIWTMQQHYIVKNNRSDRFLEAEYKNIAHIADRARIFEPEILAAVV